MGWSQPTDSSLLVLVPPDFMRDFQELVPACLPSMSVVRFLVVLDCHEIVSLQRDCHVFFVTVVFGEVSLAFHTASGQIIRLMKGGGGNYSYNHIFVTKLDKD